MAQPSSHAAGPKKNWIPYCTGRYDHDYCLELARKLRASGNYRGVRVGATIREYDGRVGCYRKFSRVYVAR